MKLSTWLFSFCDDSLSLLYYKTVNCDCSTCIGICNKLNSIEHIPSVIQITIQNFCIDDFLWWLFLRWMQLSWVFQLWIGCGKCCCVKWCYCRCRYGEFYYGEFSYFECCMVNLVIVNIECCMVNFAIVTVIMMSCLGVCV